MTKRKWEHLIISPDYVPPVLDDIRDDKGDIKTGRTLGQTYSSSDLFPDCKVNMSLSWFYEIPNKIHMWTSMFMMWTNWYSLCPALTTERMM